jgi:alkaline phosphatase D
LSKNQFLIWSLDYTKLRESQTKIYGIWDDHDSGINDGGKHNPNKEAIRQMFLDIFNEPADSPRRTQNGGMYASYFLDPEQRVKLILLDNRYDNDEKKM